MTSEDKVQKVRGDLCLGLNHPRINCINLTAFNNVSLEQVRKFFWGFAAINMQIKLDIEHFLLLCNQEAGNVLIQCLGVVIDFCCIREKT